jgi:hypothetical protein
LPGSIRQHTGARTLLRMTDLPLAPLLHRADAITGGVSDGELARLVRRGELTRLQRGTYRRGTDPMTDTARHAAVVAATVAGLRVPGIVSHVSAAVLHGLPLWNVRLGRVHLIRRPPANGSGTKRLHLHIARLPDDEVAAIDGIAVTDVTRTVIDVARSVPFESAVVVADAALASRKTTQERLAECLRAMGSSPGTRRAARVVNFADGRIGSVGESRSRVLLQRIGVPAPDLQVRLFRADGSAIGRCDFAWSEHRTVGEFDGRIKYGRLLRPGQSPGDVVYEEKLREDEIRDIGWQVARWTWGDLDRPRVVGDRLQRAFARA